MHTFSSVKFGFLGFGSIGQALACALRSRHGVSARQMSSIAADTASCEAARRMGVAACLATVTSQNHTTVLDELGLGEGDVLVQVALDVSSEDLIAWCQARRILYIDTWMDPWAQPGGPGPNWEIRERVLRARRPGTTTAVVCHGANPGLVSHFVRPGLLGLADALGVSVPAGASSAELAQLLGARAVQIAEHDTQAEPEQAPGSKPGACCIASTWAPESLAAEALQACEVAWGSHELAPADCALAMTAAPSPVAISAGPGGRLHVKTWTPLCGETSALALTHFESFTIANTLTLRDGDRVTFRPTVYYAYRPAPVSWASLCAWAEKGFPADPAGRLLRESLTQGSDALGLLFLFDTGMRRGAFWYGSTVSLEQARALVPDMNATASQVVGALLGALAWMLRNPAVGTVEPEDLNSAEVLAVALPYLGDVAGHLTSWTPCEAGALRFNEFFANGDPA